MSGVGHGAEAAREYEALTSDFESIRRMTEGHPVYMSWDDPIPVSALRSPFSLFYYLARSHLYLRFLVLPYPCHPGFVVTHERVAGAALLTPDNRHAFLYDRGDYDRNTARAAGEPETPPERRKTDCSHLGRPSGPSSASPSSG